MNRKSIFLMLLFLCLTTTKSYADFSLRLAYGFLFNDQINDSALQDGSYDLGGEFLINPLDDISIGFGVQYTWPAEYETVPDNLLSNPINTSVPIYGVAVYNIMPDSTIEPYVIGRLGYGLVTANPNSAATSIIGDFFYSVGIGGIFNNFYVEGSYDVNHGNYAYNYKNVDYNFVRFTLRIGYTFEFTNKSSQTLYNSQVEVIKEDTNRTYDNLEIYDDEGNIEKKKGTYKELKDFKIID